MTETIRIENIAQYVGEEVRIQGWLYNRTDKGKLQFLQVRDGSGFVQCVVFKKEVPEEVFETARRLTQESSLIVTGVVRQDDRAPGVPGGYEIGVTGLEVIQLAQDYPIQPKEHGVDFLMDHRHLWIRSRRQWAVLRVRATVVRAIRDWLDDHGFVNMDTPILTPAACEGTTTLFETDYFGDPAYLTQSGQLYNEANIYAFGRVYCFGPTFRAEKSKTRRHLTEFWMVEPEIAFCDLDQLMEIEEQFVSYIVQRCLEERSAELALLGRDTSLLEKVEPPFPRISYDEALEILAEVRDQTEDPELKELLRIEWGEDFGSPHETELTKRFDKPVFVYGYPTIAKAFYMEPWPGRPEVTKSVDLLAPEGYGEITGGSERISDPDLLLKRLEEWNLPREAFEWYIDLRKYGSVPHSGFGLGVERTVTWICGLNHLRETIPFPRMLKRVYP
ncbi:MAG TPA: asparagine--tRNA ligase [Thermoflexia bacterium]|jgi:asparaginyl-tRNA synthetase|nr:asparagine--tRNA ligase [Thermoflexia bacterium]